MALRQHQHPADAAVGREVVEMPVQNRCTRGFRAFPQRAVDMIKGLTEDAEVGKIYRGKVKRIMNFGAFVEILPNKDGLVHVSELSDKYVKNVDEVVKVGDEFNVKVVGIDELGRINLSKKQAPQDK